MVQEIKEVQHALLKWRDFRLKLFVEGIVVGLIAGAIVVAFRYALESAEAFRATVYRYMVSGDWTIIVAWFSCLLLIAYILGLIIKFEPLSGGSGIPQVKGDILGVVKIGWLRVLVAKFIGGVLAIGAGMSLGREGPSIQIGAVVGQGVSRTLGRTRMEERYLLTSGASAGLAAAFNAPLAGVIFALEELHKNFSPAVLMSAIAASLTADFVVRSFFGREPFWNFIGVPVLPFHYYGLLVILGIVTGVLGVAFNKLLIKTLDIYARQQLLPKGLQSLFPLLVGGLAGFVLPEILGGGNNLINTISTGQVGVVMLFILLLAKFAFTMISYGSGVPGGIFLPMLVIGALIGGVFSKVLVVVGLSHEYHVTFIILAMGAYFTAIVKAPITGSILITEMTGSFSHLLEMIAICMVAYVVADIAKSQPIYDVLLDRLIRQKKPLSSTAVSKRTVVELVVCLDSRLDGQQVKEIEWPADSLLVCIRRGNKELVPQGETTLFAGDYLYVSVNEEKAKEIKIIAEECVLAPGM
ncbi:MAG: H(+)/Cl(-) exchange transporter ClcA [Negativicutes bacterium]|nr:H(+)/Cl(-) exchange transporter ClcA [Negativicutes bacterium]